MAGLPKRSLAIILEKALAELCNNVWNRLGLGQHLETSGEELV